MPTFYGSIDLSKNEIRNAVAQNLGSAPSSPNKGQFYFNSSDNTLYWYDGAQWIAAKAAAGAVPAGTVTTQAVGDAPVVGVSTNFAREDHKHGREAFGAAVATTTYGLAKADGSAATLARSDHTHGTVGHDALDLLTAPTGSVNLNGQRIINLADPVNPSDAASKNYADNLAQGLDAKQSVKCATVSNIANLGAAPATIDGITLVNGDRVLVKDQTTQSQNGIYTYSASVLTRAQDANIWAELPSAYTWVEQGSTQADTGWLCTVDQGGTLDTTAVTWTQFSGAGQIIAGAGLSKIGNTIDVGAGSGIIVAADNIMVDGSVVAQTGTTITAGAGLTGGGSLLANRTIDVVAADSSIIVNPDSIQVNAAFFPAKLTMTPVKTGNYTAAANEDVLLDPSSGAITVTLPTTPLDGTNVRVRLISTCPATCSVVPGGSDTIFGGPANFYKYQGDWVWLQYVASGTVWRKIEGFTSNVRPWNSLVAPSSFVTVNNQKIMALADATTATDAMNRQSSDARYAQLATLTTKGDIYVATAAGVLTRMGVGADGTALLADSSQTTGLRFGSPVATGTVLKYAAALTGTASPETVTHNLNTRDVHVAVYNGATPYTAVEVDWDATTVNTVTIRYTPNLGAGYRVVVMG